MDNYIFAAIVLWLGIDIIKDIGVQRQMRNILEILRLRGKYAKVISDHQDKHCKRLDTLEKDTEMLSTSVGAVAMAAKITPKKLAKIVALNDNDKGITEYLLKVLKETEKLRKK